MLCYVVPGDNLEESLGIGESTAFHSLKAFFRAIVLCSNSNVFEKQLI